MNSGKKPRAGAVDVLGIRLGAFSALTEAERQSILSLRAREPRMFAAEDRLLSLGGVARAPSVILSGWAAEVRKFKEGRVHIVRVLLPGDVIGLSRRERDASPVQINALTRLSMVNAPELAIALRDPDQSPGIALALELIEREDAWLNAAQMARLGAQDAYARLAGIILDFEYRLQRRGLAHGGEFVLPLTQETLGQLCGLSVVHVNRTLKALRASGAIEQGQGGRTRICNRELLEAASEFVTPVLIATEPERKEAIATH